MLRTRNLDAPTWEIVLSQAISGWGGGFTTVAAQIGCQSVVRHQGEFECIFLAIVELVADSHRPCLRLSQTSQSQPPFSSP